VVLSGVLALQGDWRAHGAVLEQLGAGHRPVRTAAELEGLSGLVMPGGESTTMLRLMEAEDLGRRIREQADSGMVILGTCAGVILLAEAVVPQQRSLALLSVEVARNAYGRQVHSRVASIDLEAELGAPRRAEGVFIRAPRITRVGDGVEVLGRLDGDPVLVREGNVLGATYHPELAADRRVHELFLSMQEDRNG
jgi:5'-phosphate synthase pdxT subunit